ncbi:MAG: hypothetical protein JW984_13165 [Deltaproteobacteria bacterium]|uniref:Cyclophilin TM1367-like domain-containing protein n=1 Tax=Candidatus Zymogenus saltonus TaxID=2844893 RepID=A0A9D8KHK2_9DELT|nr:hypothetical protein [Candidatus Zymogenus saltonus]
MSDRIIISAGDVELEAEIYTNDTGRKVSSILPITGSVKRWGEEIYFSIPLSIDEEEDARDLLKEGELGYWPSGEAFCIFFGKTPASRVDEIRAAGNVNVFGMVLGDAKLFTSIKDGAKITVTGVDSK